MKRTITVKGLCPGPSIEATRASKEMKDGDVLVVEFDCEDYILEARSWANRKGHRFELAQDDERGLWVITFTLGIERK